MRLFVALELTDELREVLAGRIARLKPLCRSASWARPEGMHVTLKFIGHAIADGDGAKLAAVRTALAQVVSGSPVEMCFRGTGFFPSVSWPHVFWCGIEASPNLASLASDIDRALEPLGIPRETRAFVPHLTLARFKSPRGIPSLLRETEKFTVQELGHVRATKFHLFESKLKPSGAEHLKIESFSFVRPVS